MLNFRQSGNRFFVDAAAVQAEVGEETSPGPASIENRTMTDKYQQCPCGSGRKFKFCCYEKRISLNEMPERELIRRAIEFPVFRCLITSGWQDAGIAQIIVLRQLPDLRYIAGMYLVDVFCLGLKDTFAWTRFEYEDLKQTLLRFPHYEEISYEDARSVILGAVEYAAQFGFEPHEEWAKTGAILETMRPFERKFTFGHEGKPFYIEGAHDDEESIMERLEPLIANGEAHFLTRADSIDHDFDGVLEE